MKKHFMAVLLVSVMTIGIFSNVNVKAAENIELSNVENLTEITDSSKQLTLPGFNGGARQAREATDLTTVPHGQVGSRVASIKDSKGATQNIYYVSMEQNIDNSNQINVNIYGEANNSNKDNLYGFAVGKNNGDLQNAELQTVGEFYGRTNSTKFKATITFDKYLVEDKQTLYLGIITGNEQSGDVTGAAIVNIDNQFYTGSYGFNVSYNAHVENVGWQEPVINGSLSGTAGKALRVEGFKLQIQNPPSQLSIKYRTHVQEVGWQSWVSDGQMAGTTGRGLRIEALQIKLEGTDAKNYSVEYQAHVENEGWQPWVSDGIVSGSEGERKRVEAIRVRIVPKKTIPKINYQTQIQNIGWQGNVSDGMLSGTVGKGLRLEGIRINLENAPQGLKVKYRTHVQNEGWQDWKYSGDLSGTVGKSLRLEALQIVLEGTDAQKYSVEYKTQVENIGWQPWVRDGAVAGTSGKALKLETVKVRIVEKK